MEALEKFKQAVKIIHENNDASDFDTGVSEIEIQAAEKILELEFPPSYRSFLKQYGVGSFNGIEFYGIISGKIPGSSVPSMTWLSLENRKTPNYSSKLLSIMSSGFGPIFCIDTSNKTEDGESAIILWDPSKNKENPPEIISKSFGAFFLDEIIKTL